MTNVPAGTLVFLVSPVVLGDSVGRLVFSDGQWVVQWNSALRRDIAETLFAVTEDRL